MGKKISEEDFAAHFWGKCLQQDGCWPWQACKNKAGYGVLRYKQKNLLASRVAFELSNGILIPEGQLVRHTCDTPSCVNPLHLILGSHTENTADKMERHRHNNQKKTHCKRGHALFGDNLIMGKKQRTCRTCFNAMRRGEL